MNMNGRERNADQCSTTIKGWASSRPPKQRLSLSDWVRLEKTSGDSTRLSLESWFLGIGTDMPEGLSIETKRLAASSKSLGSCILDFYPSASMTTVKVGEFEDETAGQLERSYGLDPVAIFNKMTEDEGQQLTPEQNITLFALRLAMIEKLASGFGTLSFIWASTILLGGFASSLNPVDFTVIALILVTEGTRIFSRSRELEWHRLASAQSSLAYQSAKILKLSKSYGSRDLPQSRGASETAQVRDIPDKAKIAKVLLGIPDVKSIRRMWSRRLLCILPDGWSAITSTRRVSTILYWTQISSAVICVPLSIWRLSRQEYNPPVISRQDTPVNLYTSLNLFYTLALTEALLFLVERVYWEYKINYEQLMVQMSNKADLGEGNQEMMKQFFYEIYTKCIDGSVFDGLTMDIVEYSWSLLRATNPFENLSGLKLLGKIIDRYHGYSLDALRRTGAAPGVIERLVEMLSWRGTHQDETRLAVAALICQLVRYSKNCFRIAAVPGSIDGIFSLLRPRESDHVQFQFPRLDIYTATDLLQSERAVALRLDGLDILVALARDPVNLLKIGEKRGLIPILLAFIAVKDAHAFRKMEGSELKTCQRALRLLEMFSAARNTRGTILGPVIVSVLSSIANVRDILEFGDSHPQLQWMAIEILSNLTLDDDIRRTIGSTGGVIRNLFSLYSRNLGWSAKSLHVSEMDWKAEIAVSKRAGDALDLLATQCRKNCTRMMDLGDENGNNTFIPTLLRILNEDREQTICAAKILRSLLEYDNYSHKREIAVCIERVMKLIMESSSERLYEATVGLASRVVRVLDDKTYIKAFGSLDRTELVRKLLRNLDYSPHGFNYTLPRIRRHSIELIRVLINRDPSFFEEFVRVGSLEKKLLQTLDTLCEAEDFVIFSGAEGFARHAITMEDLVQQSIREVRMLDQEREQIPLSAVEFGVCEFPPSSENILQET